MDKNWFFMAILIAACAHSAPLAYWRLDGGRSPGEDAYKKFDLAPLGKGPHPSYRAAQCLVPESESLPKGSEHAANGGSLAFYSGALESSALGVELNGTAPFTIEGWFRIGRKTADGTLTLASVEAGRQVWRLTLAIAGGQITPTVVTGSSETKFSRCAFAADCSWHFAALAFDPAKSEWRFTLDSRETEAAVAGALPETAEKPRFILGGSGNGPTFPGDLDLWRVSRGVTPPDRQLFSKRVKPLAWWPLNDADGRLETEDRAGKFPLMPGKHGGVNAVSIEPENLPNPDFRLDGRNGKFVWTGCAEMNGELGKRSLLCAEGLGKACDWNRGFTVEGWLKRDGEPDERRGWYVVGARDDANGWSLFLNKTPDGQLRFSLYASDVSDGGDFQFEEFFGQTGNLAEKSGWMHVALVCHPGIGNKGAWVLYLNGEWSGTIPNPARPGRPQSFPDLYLGGRPSFSNSFRGKMRGWRVADGPLNADALLCMPPDGGQLPRIETQPGHDPRDLRGMRSVALPDNTGKPSVAALDEGIAVLTLTRVSNGQDNLEAYLLDTRTMKLDGPHPIDDNAAGGTLFKTPFNRLYCLYNRFPSDTGTIPRDAPAPAKLAMKYSDDGGKNWSKDRIEVPLRETAIDARNPQKGQGIRFWCGDQPFSAGKGRVFFPLTKFGSWPANEGEGWLLAADGMLEERNAGRIKFSLLPDGQSGIRNPEFGPRQAEHRMVPLGETGILCVFHTDGNPGQSLSANGGTSWSVPERMVCGAKNRYPFRCWNGTPWVFTHNGKVWAVYPDLAVDVANRGHLFAASCTVGGGETAEWSTPALALHSGGSGEFVTWMGWVGSTEPVLAATTNRGELRLIPASAILEAGQNGGGQMPEIRKFRLEVQDWSQVHEGEVLLSTMDGRRGYRISRMVSRRNDLVVRFELFDGEKSFSWDTESGLLPTAGKAVLEFRVDYAARWVGVLASDPNSSDKELSLRGWSALPELDGIPGD